MPIYHQQRLVFTAATPPPKPPEPPAPPVPIVSLKQALQAAEFLRGFIGRQQLQILTSNAKSGEEHQFFRDKLVEMRGIIEAMPKTYQQDGLGEKAVVHLHYFTGGCDWHITEKDSDSDQEGQIQAFGLANLGYGAELGYISIMELIENNVEIDLHWSPKTIGEIRANELAVTD